ncbi:MAG TPA: hypothetical protein VG408_10625 [Actinomycetota bacterium]|nr:hypothetical protein [Actinomycetota bacterium]
MKRLLCIAMLALTACASGTEDPIARPSASGPPTIDYQLVRQHALQFDVDVPSRPPGSQHELAAATYIVGHLQLAGYSPTLSAVPVADQVQSTNVVALPPIGEDPEVVVTVGYAHDGEGSGTGLQIGLFLELARALNVAAPEHAVGFVATGAGDLGEATLRGFLDERGLDPELIGIPALGGDMADVGDQLFRSLVGEPD